MRRKLRVFIRDFRQKCPKNWTKIPLKFGKISEFPIPTQNGPPKKWMKIPLKIR